LGRVKVGFRSSTTLTNECKMKEFGVGGIGVFVSIANPLWLNILSSPMPI